MSVTVGVFEEGNADGLLGKLELAMRGKIVQQAARAAGGVVRKEARKRAPRSKKTGSADLQSASVKLQRAGVKSHYQTISLVVRDYGETFVAVVGAAYPAGALGYLIEHGHVLVAWGQPLPMAVEGQPYLEPAADMTKSDQQRAFIETIQDGVTQITG